MSYNMAANMRTADLGQAGQRGINMAATAGRVQDQNDLRSLYAEHGPGIMQGDPNAMNALAGLDPMAAIDVRGAQQRQRLTAEQAQQARDQIAREVAQEARAMNQAEIQRNATLMENATAYFKQGDVDGALEVLSVVDPETAQQLAGPRQRDEDFLAGLGAALEGSRRGFYTALGVRDPATVQAEAPASIQALRIRAQEAGLAQDTPEYQKFMETGGRMPEGFMMNLPDGTQIAQGNIGGIKPPSESQARIRLFGGVMAATTGQIDAMEERFNPANLPDAAAGRAGWAGNFMRSEDAQKYDALGKAWAEGALRMSTGAAATQPEIERIFATYFAQPGDTPETIALKRKLRKEFEGALDMASGGYLSSVTQQGQAPDVPSSPSAPAQALPMPPAVDPDDWQQLTPEEKQMVIDAANGGRP